MHDEDVADRLLRIPTDSHKPDGVSVWQLVQDTGYFEAYDRVSVAVIRGALDRYPEKVGDWLLYSEDKRCSSGWYIRKHYGEEFDVGFYPDSSGIEPEYYSNRLDACAAFIKHEVEEIRHGISITSGKRR